MKAPRTWIVIADGARARIVKNEGWQKGLEPVTERQGEAARKRDRDLVTDRPGRTFDREGEGRHAMVPSTDWHRFEKAKFASEMAKLIDRAATKGEFDRLVLVAPPKTLGDLRDKLGKAAAAKVTGELAKDLTNADDRDLPKHLEELTLL